MSAVRRDYLLQQIDLLRQFLARVLKTGDQTDFEAALQLVIHLQEKLFPLPPAEFLQLDVDAQVAALQHGESPARGLEKGLLYAELLQNMGSLYAFRGRPELATGARQLALYVALLLALERTPESAVAARDMVEKLVPLLDPAELHPPVRELLARFGEPSA